MSTTTVSMSVRDSETVRNSEQLNPMVNLQDDTMDWDSIKVRSAGTIPLPLPGKLITDGVSDKFVDRVMMPHLAYALILALITYLAIRFPLARAIIAIGPMFHPVVWTNFKGLRRDFQV